MESCGTGCDRRVRGPARAARTDVLRGCRIERSFGLWRLWGGPHRQIPTWWLLDITLGMPCLGPVVGMARNLPSRACPGRSCGRGARPGGGRHAQLPPNRHPMGICRNAPDAVVLGARRLGLARRHRVVLERLVTCPPPRFGTTQNCTGWQVPEEPTWGCSTCTVVRGDGRRGPVEPGVWRLRVLPVLVGAKGRSGRPYPPDRRHPAFGPSDSGIPGQSHPT